MSPARPPWLGRVLLRLRPLGRRRADVRADLLELFAARRETLGRRRASWRYVADAASLWLHPLPDPHALAAPSPRPRGAMAHDLAFALRIFRRQRGLVGTAVAGLALAIALGTCVFTLVDAAVLRGSGFHDPSSAFTASLSRLWTRTQSDYSPYAGDWAYSDFLRVQDATPGVRLAAMARYGGSVRMGATTLHDIVGRAVSGNYFDVAGARVVKGRALSAADDQPDAAPAAVIAYALWTARLQSDPSVIGTPLWINEHAYTVVGVLEPGFSGMTTNDGPASFWVTLSQRASAWAEDQAASRRAREAEVAALQQKSSRAPQDEVSLNALRASLHTSESSFDPPVLLVARLSSTTSAAQAGTAMTAAARALASGAGAADAGRITVTLAPLDALDRSEVAAVGLVMAFLGLVLIVAATNVTNVLLASATGRTREFGTRLAIGAGRGRIVQQLLTESTLLGLSGGLAGFLAGVWLTPLLARMARFPDTVDFGPTWSAFGLAIGLAVLTGLIAGLAPARRIRRGDLSSALKTDRLSAPGRARPARLRSILVASQAAASLVLLVVAALFAHSVGTLAAADLGYVPDRLLAVQVNLGRGYDDGRRAEFWRRALAAIDTAPGVRGLALAAGAPFELTVGAMPDGRYVHRNMTSPDYFAALGTPILRGRAYSSEEQAAGTAVAVISNSLARAYWRDEDPIGSSLERVWGSDDPPGAPFRGFLSKPAGTRVIGVAADTVSNIRNADGFAIYTPLRRQDLTAARLIVRTEGPAELARSHIAAALQASAGGVPIAISATAVSEYRARALRFPTMIAAVTATIGLSALVLSVIGLVGVTAFAARQREHEVGVRMTLGATGSDIRRMMLRDGLRPVAAGVAAGLVLAFVTGRLVQRALYGVTGHDPIAITAAVVVLLTSATLAVLIPARRAVRVDPATILREG